jgi:hypothetical protein
VVWWAAVCDIPGVPACAALSVSCVGVGVVACGCVVLSRRVCSDVDVFCGIACAVSSLRIVVGLILPASVGGPAVCCLLFTIACGLLLWFSSLFACV